MPRVEFAGAFYHVMCRGDRREPIYRDDADRELFLQTLGEACGRTGWHVDAYVCMGNHYHLLMETPEPNLAAGMHWFQATYTIRFNRRHRLTGHVFGGRYKSMLIDPEEPGHFVTVSDYIHLNPVRAGLVDVASPEGYRWSSLPVYAGVDRARPDWLRRSLVMDELGWRDSPANRRRYRNRMRERAADAGGEEFEELRRGWMLGGESFRERLQEMWEKAGGVKGPVEIPRDHGDMEARRLLEAGLAYFELMEAELDKLSKSDWRKRVMGHLIKRETTVSLGWLGRELRMGSAGNVSRKCGRIDDIRPATRVSKALDQIKNRA